MILGKLLNLSFRLSFLILKKIVGVLLRANDLRDIKHAKTIADLINISHFRVVSGKKIKVCV